MSDIYHAQTVDGAIKHLMSTVLEAELRDWNRLLNSKEPDGEKLDSVQYTVQRKVIAYHVRYTLGIGNGNLELALDAAERMPKAAAASFEKRVAAGQLEWDVAGEFKMFGLGGYHPDDITDIVVQCLAIELGLTYGVPDATSESDS